MRLPASSGTRGSMIRNSKNSDTIIGGGGRNGPVAARYLAKAGKSVLLPEAHDELTTPKTKHT